MIAIPPEPVQGWWVSSEHVFVGNAGARGVAFAKGLGGGC